jgi:hypothetical protein
MATRVSEADPFTWASGIDIDGERVWFAGIGDSFVQVEEQPQPDHEQQIRDYMNGVGRKTMPVLIAKRYLQNILTAFEAGEVSTA